VFSFCSCPTPGGRNYHVSHIKALADGGAQHVDNIEPMDPIEHIRMHMENGDFARWARRAGMGKVFGALPPEAPVAPPSGGPALNAIGILPWISDLTGILSGRISTGNLNDFTTDMLALPRGTIQKFNPAAPPLPSDRIA
jgi:hypothetical protein